MTTEQLYENSMCSAADEPVPSLSQLMIEAGKYQWPYHALTSEERARLLGLKSLLSCVQEVMKAKPGQKINMVTIKPDEKYL